MKNFAHLRPESPFYPVFPRGMAPIHNILVPECADLEGLGRHECYMVDLTKVEPEQKIQIAAIIVKERGGSFAECLEFLTVSDRIPVRLEHVSGVSTDAMAFL